MVKPEPRRAPTQLGAFFKGCEVTATNGLARKARVLSFVRELCLICASNTAKLPQALSQHDFTDINGQINQWNHTFLFLFPLLFSFYLSKIKCFMKISSFLELLRVLLSSWPQTKKLSFNKLLNPRMHQNSQTYFFAFLTVFFCNSLFASTFFGPWHELVDTVHCHNYWIFNLWLVTLTHDFCRANMRSNQKDLLWRWCSPHRRRYGKKYA